MIEPVRDALTTSIRPACRAKNAMMSSAMLPNVALRIPPTCGPVSEPSRSVERPTTQARPRIASAATMKMTVGSACNPKSSTIATMLVTTVRTIAARPTRDSGPRMGNRDPLDPAGSVVAVMRRILIERIEGVGCVETPTRDPGGRRDPPRRLTAGHARRHESLDLTASRGQGIAGFHGRTRRVRVTGPLADDEHELAASRDLP